MNAVLISGAGPAGQALAYWLARHGFTPTVIERAPALRDGGQAVDIRGAAIDVAARMGILDAVRLARTRTRGMTYVCSTGKPVASMNGAFGAVGPDDVEIVRGDLTSILYEATRNDVEYIFDDSITDLFVRAKCPVLTFPQFRVCLFPTSCPRHVSRTRPGRHPSRGRMASAAVPACGLARRSS
jgi:2-polyprenyl-6-methoxyphenol hydroxylase-like FAD-dependent oxidoreductase